VRSVEKRRDRDRESQLPDTAEQAELPDVPEDGLRQDTATYKKAVHFDLMNELLALALQCDQSASQATCSRTSARSTSTDSYATPLRSHELGAAAGVCGEWMALAKTAAG